MLYLKFYFVEVFDFGFDFAYTVAYHSLKFHFQNDLNLRIEKRKSENRSLTTYQNIGAARPKSKLESDSNIPHFLHKKLTHGAYP